MTNLSPAAQAVLNVFIEGYICNSYGQAYRSGLAAAIRELADQVTPSDAVEPRNNLPMAMECQRIRSEILSIAAELEAQP